MVQDEEFVEKIFNMHFPSKEIHCQTNLTWVNEMVELNLKIDRIESNFERISEDKSTSTPSPIPLTSSVETETFNYGVIVNETETNGYVSETEQVQDESLHKKQKLRGPKCIRRKNGYVSSSDDELEADTTVDILKHLNGANPNTLLTYFRCPYCRLSQVSKEKIDHHILYTHSIASTSKANPRYKRAKKQKMKVFMKASDKVEKKHILNYENSLKIESQLFRNSTDCDSELEENFMNEDNDVASDSSPFLEENDTANDSLSDNDADTESNWKFCDATLPENWKYREDLNHKKSYKSPCGEILQSREQIIDFMLGKGIEIHHPTGFQSITPSSIDCDGLCEGACDYFKIFRRFFHKDDKNMFRKTTSIKFFEDKDSVRIMDNLAQVDLKQDNDVKLMTYLPGIVRGERPWIICITEQNSIETSTNFTIADTYSGTTEENKVMKKIHGKRKRCSSEDSSSSSSKNVEKRKGRSEKVKNMAKRTLRNSSSSSRESTPTRATNKRMNSKNQMKDFIEYEGIYIQCCKKSCKKWRLVTQYKDATFVPEYWICSMNRDVTNNVCGVGGNEFNADSDKLDIKFSCGSLVWAKLKGFPWWPGMIDFCPDSEDYFWVDENISRYEPSWYHVVYFEGKGTEVTRAWIKTDDIVSMTTPIRQPKGNTAKKPGPLKQRLINAMSMAEEAKSLNRKERLKQFSFEALFDESKGKSKRIKITPKLSSAHRKEAPTQSVKKHTVNRKDYQSKPLKTVQKKFVTASYLSPMFSDDSDQSEVSEEENEPRTDTKFSVKSSDSVRTETKKPEIEKNDSDDESLIRNLEEEEDLLSQIMKKYSKNDEGKLKSGESKTGRDILDDVLSSGSNDENGPSLEETLIDDYSSCYSNSDVGMTSVVIKEETL